jgi:hypothetical protein
MCSNSWENEVPQMWSNYFIKERREYEKTSHQPNTKHMKNMVQFHKENICQLKSSYAHNGLHTQKAECYCCMSSKVYIKTFKDGTNDYWAFQSHLLERTENKWDFTFSQQQVWSMKYKDSHLQQKIIFLSLPFVITLMTLKRLFSSPQNLDK